MLPHLVQDMMQEHERIDRKAIALRQSVEALPCDPGEQGDSAVGELRTTCRRFLAELAEHARREDRELFAPFIGPLQPVAGM